MMDKAMFDELLESVKQAGAIIRNECKPSRRFEYHDIDIKKIRQKTGLSQTKFADLIGISVGTYKNWEQGRRRPQGPAMALLRIIDNDPQYAMKTLHTVP